MEITSKLVQDAEAVFHLAARISIPQSYLEPESYVDINIGGTLNMLRAAREVGVASFVQTSTSEVYGTARSVPITEEHPLTPQSPYAASKVASDAIAYSFYRSFGLNVAIVRPFNVYGPRQSVRAVVPSVILQILARKDCIELGNLEPTRDMNYVGDTVRAFKEVGFAPECVGKTLNIATQTEISIGDLTATIQALMNSDVPIKTTKQRSRTQSSEVYRLVGSSASYESTIGLHRTRTLEAGLTETIAWFRAEYPTPQSALQALSDPDMPSL
jgi:nucleoside-diphosphate-sugar epimerase